MTVLKDAASNALYGACGANGVISSPPSALARRSQGDRRCQVGFQLACHSGLQYITDPAQYYELYYQSLYNYGRFSGEIGGQGMSSAAANAWANQNITAANSYGLAYNVYTPSPRSRTL